MTSGYPPQARVRSKAEFDLVFKHGRRIAVPCMVLHCHFDGQSARLGLAVSRKVDARAVGRNRIKRILRNHFRLLRTQLPGGAYVIVARPLLASMSAEQVRQAFHGLLERAGALPRTRPDGTMPTATPLHAPTPGVSGE